jgi:hypothetical protein
MQVNLHSRCNTTAGCGYSYAGHRSNVRAGAVARVSVADQQLRFIATETNVPCLQGSCLKFPTSTHLQ